MCCCMKVKDRFVVLEKYNIKIASLHLCALMPTSHVICHWEEIKRLKLCAAFDLENSTCHTLAKKTRERIAAGSANDFKTFFFVRVGKRYSRYVALCKIVVSLMGSTCQIIVFN